MVTMAKTTGTASLVDLIERKALKPGEKIIIKRRSAPTIEAVIQEDGSILLDQTRYATPTAAARRALGDRPVDGWVRWRVVRLQGRSLAEVRDDG